MPEADRQNIEIKVRVGPSEREQIEQYAIALKARAGGTSMDVDTYFHVARGRLKLRIRDGEPAGTLISYERPNEATSRLSDYRLIPIPDAFALRKTLTQSLGVLVTVTKRRTVFLYGATRIHFDDVDELGTFIELETVLGMQSYDAALAEHRFVFDTLGLSGGEIVPESYSDLLLDIDSVR